MLFTVACSQQPHPPSVLAAASLDGVIEAVAPGARCSYSASSTAARQVAAGAPVDLLVVADARWLEVAGDRIGDGVVIAANRLVLVTSATATAAVALDGPPPGGRIAIGDPGHVPVGRYARQALEALGWWAALEPRLLPATDARATLRLVAIGEADFALVYASDAAAEPRVRVVAEIRPELHDPITYVAAVVDGSAAGATLLDGLRGPAGAAALAAAGLRPMLGVDAEP